MITLEEFKKLPCVYTRGGIKHHHIHWHSQRKSNGEWEDFIVCDDPVNEAHAVSTAYDLREEMFATKEEALEADVKFQKERLEKAEQKLLEEKQNGRAQI